MLESDLVSRRLSQSASNEPIAGAWITPGNRTPSRYAKVGAQYWPSSDFPGGLNTEAVYVFASVNSASYTCTIASVSRLQ